MSRASTRKLIREENIPQPPKYFSVVSLLSSYGGGLIRNNGDRVRAGDTLEGKHVMVCCFDVPGIFYGTPVNIHSVVNLCKELYSTRKEKQDFEMVVVTRMQYDDKEGFDQLLSVCPESCLAVPFEDRKRHEYVCNALNLTSRDSFKCVFVNPDGKLCPFFIPNNSLKVRIFENYGAEAFPFTEEVLKKRIEEYRRMVSEVPTNLEAILRCNDSSPAYVYKFGDDNNSSRRHISQLSNSKKHVGVLLCCEGGLIPHLVTSYEQCREKGLDFEIVVVYMPFNYFGDTEPEEFKKKMDGLMHKHIDTCRRWWCLPFDNSVSRRFWRMSKHYCACFDRCECDKLIVVGPGIDRLDRYSGEMVKYQGGDAYPFTTEAAITNKMNKLREFTLESLFAGTGVYRGTDAKRRVVPVGELRANKVFLVMEVLKDGCDFKASVPVYHELKERFGYEVIFVDIEEHTMPGLLQDSPLVSDEERWEIESEMPWYICPPNKPLIDWFNLTFLSLFGFGDDGRLCFLSSVSHPTFSLQDFTSGTLYDQVKSLIMLDP